MIDSRTCSAQKSHQLIRSVAITLMRHMYKDSNYFHVPFGFIRWRRGRQMVNFLLLWSLLCIVFSCCCLHPCPAAWPPSPLEDGSKYSFGCGAFSLSVTHLRGPVGLRGHIRLNSRFCDSTDDGIQTIRCCCRLLGCEASNVLRN